MPCFLYFALCNSKMPDAALHARQVAFHGHGHPIAHQCIRREAGHNAEQPFPGVRASRSAYLDECAVREVTHYWLLKEVKNLHQEGTLIILHHHLACNSQ